MRDHPTLRVLWMLAFGLNTWSTKKQVQKTQALFHVKEGPHSTRHFMYRNFLIFCYPLAAEHPLCYVLRRINCRRADSCGSFLIWNLFLFSNGFSYLHLYDPHISCSHLGCLLNESWSLWPFSCLRARTVFQWDVLLSNVSLPALTRSSCLRSPRVSLFWWTEVVHNQPPPVWVWDCMHCCVS